MTYKCKHCGRRGLFSMRTITEKTHVFDCPKCRNTMDYEKGEGWSDSNGVWTIEQCVCVKCNLSKTIIFKAVDYDLIDMDTGEEIEL